MILYQTTLKHSDCSVIAIDGSFSHDRSHEIITLYSGCLKLTRLTDTGTFELVHTERRLGKIRSVAKFRPPGHTRDAIAYLSDDGYIKIAVFDTAAGLFKVEDTALVGRSGRRRAVPGEYIVVDPMGRTLMVCAIERQALLYLITRSSDNSMKLSSPIEAHRSDTIVHAVCAMDVGHENPLFAVLESRSGIESKSISFYELDLGVNHVSRRSVKSVPVSANVLLAIPVAQGGGLLVCCSNFVIYVRLESESIFAWLPRRLEAPENFDIMICTGCVRSFQGTLIVLIQSDLGDIYRLSVGVDGSIKLSYFDTIPAASSISISRGGYLVASHELGNTAVFQIIGLGDGEVSCVCGARELLQGPITPFRPRPLVNILQLSYIHSLSPLLDMVSSTGGQGALIAACQRGLQIVDLCFRMNDLAVTELPGIPSGLFTIGSGGEHMFIAVSFSDSTLVLRVGEEFSEVVNTGLCLDDSTLMLTDLPDGSILQVCRRSVRLVRNSRTIEWLPPNGLDITLASCSAPHVLLSLSNGMLVILGVDNEGFLGKISDRLILGLQVTCLAMQPVTNHDNGTVLALIGLSDGSLRCFSLDEGYQLKQLAALALSSVADSCCFSDWTTQQNIFAGLRDGSCLCGVIDLSNGGYIRIVASDIIGSRSVMTKLVSIGGKDLVAALSSSIALYSLDGKQICGTRLKLSCSPYLDFISSLTYSECYQGIVGIFDKSLCISSPVDLFESPELLYRPSFTPRRVCELSTFSRACLAVIESDHSVYNEETTVEINTELSQIDITGSKTYIQSTDYFSGPFIAGEGKWASCIRIFDLGSRETICKIDLSVDEAAIDMISCCFSQLHENIRCLVVATARDLHLHPRKVSSASLKTYLVNNDCKLKLVHCTELGDSYIPLKVAAICGRLIASFAGVPALRLYELGKRKLLLKSEFTSPHQTGYCWLEVVGNRVFAGDLSNSIQVLQLEESDLSLKLIYRDGVSRWISCGAVLDFQTVIAADKFGNIFVLRTTTVSSEESPGFLIQLCQTDAGDLVTSIKLAKDSAGSEVIVAATITGSLIAFKPIQSRRTANILRDLESIVRRSYDDQMLRFSYLPRCGIVDGDICGEFMELNHLEKQIICKEIGCGVSVLSGIVGQLRYRLV